MTKTIWVIGIEPLESRYTFYWHNHIPNLLKKAIEEKKKDINVVSIDGEQPSTNTTPGAFLDFGATNIFKSSQLSKLAELFRTGKIKEGDKILFTDAWNPNVIQVKYMSSLLNIPVEIHGMWHAGSYDPEDFLGRLIGDADWVRSSEKAMYHCFDTNWFATNFHMNMYCDTLMKFNDQERASALGIRKIALTGWPMEYLYEILKPYTDLPKKDLILFPHRVAPEKQIEIFKDLAKELPQFEWKVCQETSLSKHEYHTLLGESRMVFSANLQETYGISMIEGLICNSMPYVPNRLSYSEMYYQPFLYPNIWSDSWENYQKHKQYLVNSIQLLMVKSKLPTMKLALLSQLKTLEKYTSAYNMINALTD